MAGRYGTESVAATKLRAHLEQNNITRAAFAKTLKVAVSCVYGWLAGQSPKSLATREAIERETKGAVKKDDWPMPAPRTQK
jgi:DNA-binding transcriptional regulator YiaG